MTGTITTWETDGIFVSVTVEGEGHMHTVPMAAQQWTQLLDSRGGLANVIGQAVEVRGAGAAASVIFADESD